MRYRACYREQKLAGGKARAIGDRGKQAEKVAGDCGSHKRVWVALRTADTCKKATRHKEECTRLTTRHIQGTNRRLPYSLRMCEDRIDTCRRLPDSLQWCKTVSQTGGSSVGDSQTVCDGAKTVWDPAVYSKSVCDGANTVSAPAGDFQTVFDVTRRSLRPEGHLQETPRQSVTVPDSLSLRRRLFGNLLQVPRRPERLSCTVRDSSAGAQMVLAPS
ncbi:hypothetical protein DPMN_054597 [Dreissena polymorpha]|uniref:Uncharacterized protein n=1 Tax=Dreissena polymorpha TaxID=45954 RepID=A0A9D4HT80_DREPO|nr:hypothetical protein DPMN_054597 [Dreissena polymorpha]